MKKAVLFLLAALMLAGPAFAGGKVVKFSGTSTTSRDTINTSVVEIEPYRDMWFIFRITAADTLRDDTANIYLQTGMHKNRDSTWNTEHHWRIGTDTTTKVTEYPYDSVTNEALLKYARYYITFEDSSSYADSEVVRPASDKTVAWNSTGSDHFGEIDETSPDTADYVYADTDSSGVHASGMAAHTATETTVDSVRMNYSVHYVPVTTEVVVTSSDYIAGWSSTGANHYSVIDEALGSEDTSDYIYILGPDTLACVAIGNPGSYGTADIDSAVLSVLHHSYVEVCTLEVGLCVSSATCDTCDCATDTIAVTTDTSRTAILFTTSPATDAAWTGAELDSANLFVRSLGFGTSAEGCISQVALTPYYTADASIKPAICVTDTGQCTWGDSTAISSADTATHALVVTANPSGDSWYISSMDSLVGTVNSLHVDNGYLKVFMKWMIIYYTSGTFYPPMQYEATVILKE